MEKLRLAYPHVDSRLLIGAREIGVNPKVNNLSRGFEEAKYDIVWVVDSNIYSDPGCLGRSVDELSKVRDLRSLGCSPQIQNLTISQFPHPFSRAWAWFIIYHVVSAPNRSALASKWHF